MVALKGVPALLSPELLYALARMGHGDEIVLADLNFPASSICQCGPMEIRADGLGIPQLLEAVLKLLPLDTYVESPVRAESPLHPAAPCLSFPFCGLHRAHLPWSGGKPCGPRADPSL
ncbi:fucose mutarotase isoform X8 [Homo sapiens]|uniref:fucose mutarotase isoform X8 n=1 Tax=Homo sapiens TaxID=9606 RepID=UPI001FB09922|nr:fucose mutarotase isoform X8 [Homo sapiens]XP_054221601.1 fucose mutarotase isoform X8 [Homo sapiens]